MFLFSDNPRDLFSVPSIKCQSLLGKAVLEHFTKPEQIASVFSSSPSLRNSSAGANFLTNFRIDEQSITLCETVFTPEDCFSVQFTPSLVVQAEGSDDWEQIFNLISNLINNTRYVEASLRSLTIMSTFITDQQLQFILSHVKRIEKLGLILDEEYRITAKGLSDSIRENLSELKEFGITVIFILEGIECPFPSLLQTEEVRDLIINHVAPRATAIGAFGRLICSAVCDQKSAELYSNVESFTAILNCFHRSKTSEDARRIATSINNILEHNPSSNKLLNSLPVVEAFSFIIPLASDADAVQWISNALQKIFKNNEEAQQKFSTPEFLEIFKEMEKHTTDESNKSFHDVLACFDPSLF
jgi:hypothetical protein